MFVIGFASISLGNYINTVLDSSYLGYGIISLFYLIIFLLLFQLSKSGRLKKIIEKEMRKGLYANIHAKRKRGEQMRKKGAKGAPTAAQFRRAAQTVKKK